MKKTIFISYCHESIDSSLLDGFIKWLTGSDNRSFNLLVDKNQLRIGDSIPEFMDYLDTVDGVCILLTPEYKARCVNKTPGGVFTEYSMIVNRYNELQSNKSKRISKETDTLNFEIYPILFSGSHDDSIPNEISDLIYQDLRQFRINKKKNNEIPIDVIQKLKDARELIIDRIELTNVRKSSDYKKNFDDLYKKLFLDTKSDWLKRDGFDELQNEDPLFVRTIAYDRAERELSTFFVGRKGSGKSSITEMLWLRKKNDYKAHINIQAENLNIAYQYYIFSDEQIKSDTTEIFLRGKCLEIIWELFIYLCSIDVLVRLAEEGALTNFRKEIDLLKHQIKLIQGDKFLCEDMSENYNGLLQYSTKKIHEYINFTIENARNESAQFEFDLATSLLSRQCLIYTLTEEVFDAFSKVINRCTKRFLITFDGFDNAFDRFRRDQLMRSHNEELQQVTNFEIDWLQALVILIQRMSRPRDRKPHFDSLIHPCITVPKDRFLELISVLRDSYRLHDSFKIINWSGIELAIMLRKRLEELTQHYTDQIEGEEPEEKLKKLFSVAILKNIPWDIDFEYQGKNYNMPLFMYVLRHTFWRPREIIMYYAELINVAYFYSKKDKIISSDLIRHQIKEKTYGLINSEFINEFKTNLLNINVVLDRFRHSRIQLSFNELNTKIGKVEFNFALTGNENNLVEKIKYLYIIGFLGIILDDNIKSKMKSKSKQSFFFFEGYGPLRYLDSNSFSQLQYVIHPVFSEFLMLNTDENELVLQFNWEYLHDIESRMLGPQFEFDIKEFNEF